MKDCLLTGWLLVGEGVGGELSLVSSLSKTEQWFHAYLYVLGVLEDKERHIKIFKSLFEENSIQIRQHQTKWLGEFS